MNDFGRRYPTIVRALAALPNETVIDGEVVAPDETGKLKFGSAGIGTGAHLGGAEKFNLEAGIKAVYVPGDTMPKAIADTVAGHTTYLISPVSYARGRHPCWQAASRWA